MATSDKPVEERVKEIIVEQLGVEENDVAPAAKLVPVMVTEVPPPVVPEFG